MRELVEDKVIRVPFVNTADNFADFFTKPLQARTFLAMRDRIMNVPVVRPATRDHGGDAYAPTVRSTGGRRVRFQ